MSAYVIGSSALHFWRRTPTYAISLKTRDSNNLSDCPTCSKELRSLKLESLPFGPHPIHLMAPSANLRIAHNGYWYSVHQAPLPQSSFCKASQEVYVASPELCLLQSASKVPLFRLMEFAMELCGEYSLVPESERGFVSREMQITSVSLIKDFIMQVPREPGSRKALLMIKYIQDGSRSPMETREYLFLCLPKRYGGYGLPKAALNARIELTREEQVMAGREYFIADMLWEEAKLIIEYDGYEDHESRANRAKDATRRNMLIARGYTVFTITGKQICSTNEFDKIAHDIARYLNFRLRSFPNNWEERRSKLRTELFKSMSSYDAERFF